MGYKKQVWICITETPPNNVWKTFLTEWVCWVRWEINTPGSEERNNWDVPVSYQFPTFSETSFQTRLGWTCHAQQQICLQGILQWPSQGSKVCPHLTLGITTLHRRPETASIQAIFFWVCNRCVEQWQNPAQLLCRWHSTLCECQASSNFIQIKKRFEPRSKYFAP